jgi:hypothetical protein
MNTWNFNHLAQKTGLARRMHFGLLDRRKVHRSINCKALKNAGEKNE